MIAGSTSPSRIEWKPWHTAQRNVEARTAYGWRYRIWKETRTRIWTAAE